MDKKQWSWIMVYGKGSTNLDQTDEAMDGFDLLGVCFCEFWFMSLRLLYKAVWCVYER